MLNFQIVRSSIQIYLKRPAVLLGYMQEAKRQPGILFLAYTPFSIEVKKVTGSVMPTGLTAVLSREQLLDLVRFLSELGKIR